MHYCMNAGLQKIQNVDLKDDKKGKEATTPTRAVENVQSKRVRLGVAERGLGHRYHTVVPTIQGPKVSTYGDVEFSKVI